MIRQVTAALIAFLLAVPVTLAADDLSRSAELLSSAWGCNPAREDTDRYHMSWGTVFAHGFSYDDGRVTFLDHRAENVHNTEANSLTKLDLTRNISVKPEMLEKLEEDGPFLTLNCGATSCINQATSIKISDDCKGLCADQPWLKTVELSSWTLQFCTHDDVEDALVAFRHLAPHAKVETVDMSRMPSENYKKPFLCWATDPSGTPLNVRQIPGGALAFIKTLKNGTSVDVREFVRDDKNKPWADIPQGFAYARYLTCQAPEEPATRD